MWKLTKSLIVLLSLAAMLPSCRSEEAADPRAPEVDKQVRAKYGVGLNDLPADTLVLLSPNNETIQKEFGWAFSLQNALDHGRRVEFQWRDVGGGGSAMEQYLLNVYAHGESAGIDVLWGGGEFTFRRLAAEKILLPLGDSLSPEALADLKANVPRMLGGVEMYDKDLRWIGSAISGFGLLYNRTMLQRCRIDPPRTWDDLQRADLADVIALADPSQSSSAAQAYRMIALSSEDWPSGWAKLLRVLSDAKRFMSSAGEAANAPLLGETLVAMCIDFYGAIRVAEAPDDLVYISPKGQTAFTPDPIGILRNPSHPQLAARFVEFVLSSRGQALWALPPGSPDGPVRSALGRQPIRKDVYETYRGKFSPWIVNPYEAGQTLELSGEKQKVDFAVLRRLVQSAAVDNADGLRAARRKLVRTGNREDLIREFSKLPDNVATVEQMPTLVKQFKDATAAERIDADWQKFFREKYRRIVEAK